MCLLIISLALKNVEMYFKFNYLKLILMLKYNIKKMGIQIQHIIFNINLVFETCKHVK
jgi:hypothetical protein